MWQSAAFAGALSLGGPLPDDLGAAGWAPLSCIRSTPVVADAVTPVACRKIRRLGQEFTPKITCLAPVVGIDCPVTFAFPPLFRTNCMKIKAANGVARILKAEGIPWVSCYPTNHVNNALGEEGVRILMMGEERFAVAVADAFSRVTCGSQIGVCTVMSNLNAAGIQMAFGAIAQAWEDSSPVLVITEGVGQGASQHTHFDIAQAFRPVTKWVGKIDRADLVPDYLRRAFTHLRSGRPGPVLLIVPRDLGEYDESEHPYVPVKGWRSGPDPDDVKAAIKALLAVKDPLLYV